MFIAFPLTIALWMSFLVEMKMIDNALKKRSEALERTRVSSLGKGIPLPIWISAAIIFFFIGFLHGTRSMRTPMHIYLIGAVICRGIIFLIVHELTAEKSFLRRMTRQRLRPALSIFLSGLMLFAFVLGPIIIPRGIGYLRACEMLNILTRSEDATVDTFPEISPSDLRVTTREIAESICEIRKSSAASWITSVNLGMYNGTLSWICTVSETPWFNMLVGSANKIREVIVIPINDPVGQHATVIPFKMNFAEGLWWWQDGLVHASDVFPFRTFTRAYVTAYNNELVLVTTSYFEVPFTGVFKDPRVHVWNPETGQLIAEFTPNDAPEWVVQKWDETYIEVLGDSLGDFRWSRDNDLNFWNGIPRASDRSADPSEWKGLRYQMWDGELTGVYLFHNKNNPSILEFIIIVKKNELLLYKVDHLNMISPQEAKSIALSGLPPLERGTYQSPIALLYRVGDNLYYHIPVYQYYKTGEHIHYLPIYFALVNAMDRRFIREAVGEHEGALVSAIEAAYAKAVIETGRKINGTLVEKYEPVVIHGETRQWLTIEQPDKTRVNVLVKFELLQTDEERFKIVSLKVGDPVTVVVDENNVVLEVK